MFSHFTRVCLFLMVALLAAATTLAGPGLPTTEFGDLYTSTAPGGQARGDTLVLIGPWGSGVYFYEARHDGQVTVQKMALVK